MQAILKRARVLLLEVITIASVIADKKVTIAEIFKLKLRGMTQQYGLNDFIPDLTDEIRAFEELTPDEIYEITKGQDIPKEILKIVYDSARMYFLAIKRILSENPDATAEIIVSSGNILDDVKGVGPRILTILNDMGITQVKELADYDPEKLNETLKLHGPLFSGKAFEIINHAKELLK